MMKKIVLFFLGILAPGIAAFSQEITFTDSLIVYRYYEGTDSVPYRKVIYFRDRQDSLVASRTYVWDSLNLRLVLSEKTEYEYVYSGDGYRKISRGFEWSATDGTWEKSTLDTVMRDTEGRLLLTASYRWNAGTSQWTGTARAEKSYDSYGHTTRDEKYFWQEGAWQCDTLEVHDYSAGVLVSHWTRHWSDGAGACVNVSKTDYDYNEDGDLITETFYNGYGSAWLKNRKKDYTYNRDVRAVATITESYWHVDHWVEDKQEEFTYDENGRITAHYRYRAIDDLNPWEMIERTKYTYEDQWKYVESETSVLDDETGKWVNTEKWEGSYYSSNPYVWMSQTYLKWDPENNDWAYDRKEEYTYYPGYKIMWTKTLYEYNEQMLGWVEVEEWEWKYGGDILLGLDYYKNKRLFERWFTDYDYNINKITGYWLYRALDGYNLYPVRKYINTYGSNTRIIDHLEYEGYAGEWRKTYRYVYGYQGYLFSESDTICYGDSIVWRGRYLKETGLYRDALVSTTSRDSVFEMNLTVGGAYLPEYDTICSGDSLFWHGRYCREAGMHYDSIPTATGCDSVYALALTLLPAPAPFTIDGPAVTLEDHQDYYSVPEDTSLTYFWSFDNGTLATQLSGHEVLVKWGDAGEGAVRTVAVNGYGCPGDTIRLTVTIQALTGVDGPLQENIRVYPNPARDRLQVETPARSEYELVDVSGTVVRHGFVEGHGTIDIARLPAGIYLLKLDGRKVFRIVKE